VQVTFAKVELAEIRDELSRHWGALSGPTDSFFEDHVRESAHYGISFGQTRAGFASVHAGQLITQFAVAPAYQRYGQAAFQALKKLEHVRAAFVPTCDEFYLSHALDAFAQLAKQAYFFEAQPGSAPPPDIRHWCLRVASAADEELVRQQSGDFFSDTARRIAAGEIFLTQRDGECMGFGILERSHFRSGLASIGMFTIERFRGSGVGTATIALLLEACSRLGLRAVAGCWFYNHASKRTLERAGMASRTRLLRLEY
jgi:RimJ/RimL family protein N-acetyltransferase